MAGAALLIALGATPAKAQIFLHTATRTPTPTTGGPTNTPTRTPTRTPTPTWTPTRTPTPPPIATATRTPTPPPNATATPTPVPGTAGKFQTLAPCRMLDTRNANGSLGGPALTASGTRLFAVAGVCGIPTNAVSLSTNITVTQPTAAGDLAVFPGGSTVPAASAISFGAGRTIANNAVIKVSADGAARFGVMNRSAGTVHLIVDVNGYFK